ncbi:SIMPL domain-containing protein [Massilia soli]|uniref:SIMPL domain-containing protein n=1 Tax=Massilia soli TaxID=2792854 RepID=A0ABS7STZ3_9BURK|nr:SIMPL domain-containing protein [Massilia soli]MBZ2209422.1 SIMPL domain-containing protein [Massilia soli]
MFKIVAFLVALSAVPVSAIASDLPAYPFVHASGTGATSVMPDVGEIDFEIIASDTDPAAARAVVETRIAQIRALAEGLGVPGDDVEIRDIRKDLKKGADATAGVPVYDLRSGVHIKIANLYKWAELLGPLVDMPNLDGFATSFDTTEREKVESELVAQAMATARRKATAMAKGAGMKLGAVTAVTLGDLKNLSRAMGLAPSDTRYSGAGTRSAYNRKDLLAIDIVKLAQPVDMIFRLK